MKASALIVYQFPLTEGVQIGPFCLKLTTWLQMANIPFETRDQLRCDKAPKGKLPYSEVDGKTLTDSHFIIDYLIETRGVDPDADLSDEQRAVSTATMRMVEEHLYFILGASRWGEDASFEAIRKPYFGDLPVPLRWFLPSLIRRGALRNMIGQGMGRHTIDEMMLLANKDLDALQVLLGDKAYFFGDSPHSLDAAVFAQLVTIWRFDWPGPLKKALGARVSLLAFIDRMSERFGVGEVLKFP